MKLIAATVMFICGFAVGYLTALRRAYVAMRDGRMVPPVPEPKGEP